MLLSATGISYQYEANLRMARKEKPLAVEEMLKGDREKGSRRVRSLHKQGKRIPDEDREKIRALRIAGATYEEAGDAVGVPSMSAWRVCQEVDDLQAFRDEAKREIICDAYRCVAEAIEKMRELIPQSPKLGDLSRVADSAYRIGSHAAGEVTSEKPLPEINFTQLYQQILVFQQRAASLEAQNAEERNDERE